MAALAYSTEPLTPHFLSQFQFKASLHSKSDLRSFKCPACYKDFKLKSTLQQHERIHSDVRPYACIECGKNFRQQSHLTQHLRIHADEKPFQCFHCGKSFRQRAILNQHVRIHLDISQEIVFKARESQNSLEAAPPLFLSCPICQLEFKQKQTILQHGCIHIESRPYPCHNCGKRFRQQSALSQHLRIHANAKPYGCVYCARTFRQRTILNQHLRIHTNQKPYKCQQCDKHFRQKAILDQHTRTHVGGRPFCCPLPDCRRHFATEKEVAKHIDNHLHKPPKSLKNKMAAKSCTEAP